jgi:CDP-diacylglycerol--glycerol-3-phosphate 3-phosphatidyltransferase
MRREVKRRSAYLPNLLSFSRIPCALLLPIAWHRPFTFVTLYLFVGVTDLLDGYLARKLGVASDFGARLDSLADLVFYLVLLALLIERFAFHFTALTQVLLATVLLLRLMNMLLARWKYGRFVFVHTLANKATGVLAYLLPLLLFSGVNRALVLWILIIALLAAVDELFITIRYREVLYDRRSFFHKGA